jgi:hypothetical protein
MKCRDEDDLRVIFEETKTEQRKKIRANLKSKLDRAEETAMLLATAGYPNVSEMMLPIELEKKKSRRKYKHVPALPVESIQSDSFEASSPSQGYQPHHVSKQSSHSPITSMDDIFSRDEGKEDEYTLGKHQQEYSNELSPADEGMDTNEQRLKINNTLTKLINTKRNIESAIEALAAVRENILRAEQDTQQSNSGDIPVYWDV